MLPRLFVSTYVLNMYSQEGESYAHSNAFGVTCLIPTAFLNTSFEAEEAAKELTIQAAKKIKAEVKAKELVKKSAASKQANVSNTKQKTHQKPAKDKKNTEQTTASPPAKEDAPVTTPVTASGPTPQKSCDRVLTRSTF